MFVGVMKLSFHLPGARSLKDKRQTVRSFRDRVRARLEVSIAEVDHMDLHQRATFGVAVVSNDWQGPSRVWVWDAATGKEAGRIELPRRGHHLAFDRTGKRLAVSLDDTTALVYNLETALKPAK